MVIQPSAGDASGTLARVPAAATRHRVPRLGRPTIPASPPPCLPADDRTSPVFVVSEVVNASGGRTGCFLYRGSLLAPQPRSRTPDHGPWPLAAAGGCLEAAEEQLVPQAGLEDGKQPNWAALEGQQLTLYFRYGVCGGGADGPAMWGYLRYERVCSNQHKSAAAPPAAAIGTRHAQSSCASMQGRHTGWGAHAPSLVPRPSHSNVNLPPRCAPPLGHPPPPPPPPAPNRCTLPPMLLCSYEQGSPKAKQRAPRTPAAPWRVSLRDAGTSGMLWCSPS